MMINWQKIYADTPVCAEYAYFDSAAAAPPPLPVIKAVKDYLDKTAYIGTYLPTFRREVYKTLEVYREKMAKFIGAQSGEIAFTKNATEAICMLARGIDWHAGDEIILPDTEMVSNVAVWQLLEKEKGIKLLRVAANKQGIIETQSIKSLITPRTRLISFVALSNVTGAIQPVAEICTLAAQYQIWTHISASQALAMLPIDVQYWQCDFLSACGRKGLRTIEGVGILYARSTLVHKLTPTLAGWWNASVNPQSGELLFSDEARRLEAGCPNVPALYSLGAALDYADTIGIQQIMLRNQTLTRYAIAALSQLPNFELYGPTDIAQRLAIIPFNIKGIDADQLTARLETDHIIIEAGHFMATSILRQYHIEKMARISLHYFNTEEEIERLVTCLKTIIQEMIL